MTLPPRRHILGYPPGMLALCWLSTALASPTHVQMDAASWKLVTTAKHSEVGEVRIWRAEVAGIPCFRGTARVTDVDPDALLETAIDVEGAVRWSSANVAEGKVLERTASRVDYYQLLDVPGWTLASDRFWFLTAQIGRTGADRSYRWSRLTEGGKHKAVYDAVRASNPGAVEPPVNVGGWEFRVDGDQVVVDYRVCTDTGGSVPQAMQNIATRRTLPDNIGDVVRQARTLR
ncbi:MAG: hypothetical protein KTR31_16065 [Myxococcales bacterium]|nr:hypothetical protein [Myxococcales bacterium]